ncbi:MAG: fasciclin domain-containing protein [Actinobacteria bacterium]|nr:fasciclin domain-containing protein [Actinomycetota bacterium]
MTRTVIALAAVAAVIAGFVVSPATAGTTPKRDIVETAAAAGQFKTLVRLVRTAGLAKTLSGKGPYTVFAPTDAAFAKVPKSTLHALLHNRAKLRAVLLYHVVSGKVTARNVAKLRSLTTVNGAKVRIRVKDGRVYVNKARVVTPDVKASNGIIHIINRVLIPPAR